MHAACWNKLLLLYYMHALHPNQGKNWGILSLIWPRTKMQYDVSNYLIWLPCSLLGRRANRCHWFEIVTFQFVWWVVSFSFTANAAIDISCIWCSYWDTSFHHCVLSRLMWCIINLFLCDSPHKGKSSHAWCLLLLIAANTSSILQLAS